MTKSDPKDALEHAIKAAELYMRASAEAKTPADRSRIRRKIEEMITLAEYLKGSTAGEVIQPKQDRRISPREILTLVKSSKLHGCEFLPWRPCHGGPEVFAQKQGQGLYTYVERPWVPLIHTYFLCCFAIINSNEQRPDSPPAV